MLTTAGGLVFRGDLDQTFRAFDAEPVRRSSALYAFALPEST